VPVFGSLLGWAILGEVPSTIELAGIVSVSIGVFLASGIVSLRLPHRS